MNFYRIVDASVEPNTVLTYHATQADAHRDTKTYSKHRLPDLRIELVDVETDKGAIARIINGVDPSPGEVLRTWKLTPRGGMAEVPNGE